MDVRIEFILLVLLIILILFVPNLSNSFLELFDFPFINLVSILIIINSFKSNQNRGILLTLLYIFCIVQRRKNVVKLILTKQMDNLNLSTSRKIQATMSVMNNKNISNKEKENLVLQIIPMEIPKLKKYEIIKLHLNNGGDAQNVFNVLYNTPNLSHISFTKVLYMSEYKDIILDIVNRSNLDDEIRSNIIKFINEKNDKKVSFDI